MHYHYASIFTHAGTWLAAECLEQISFQKLEGLWLLEQGAADFGDAHSWIAAFEEVPEFYVLLVLADGELVRRGCAHLRRRKKTVGTWFRAFACWSSIMAGGIAAVDVAI